MSSNQEKLRKSCCFAFNCLILFILVLASIIISVNFVKNNSLVFRQCNVTNVIYPTRLPLNVTDMTGFSTCDCGKRCISDLGICISVFGSIINGEDNILFKDSIRDDYLSCTYHEVNCLNGENIQDRLEAISDTKDIAQQYIEMMNTTIDCYYDDNSNILYFDNNFDVVSMYIVFGFCGFFLITLIFQVVNFKYFCQKKIIDSNHLESNEKNNVVVTINKAFTSDTMTK